MEIFKLFGSILIDDEEANKSISRTEKNAKGMGEKLKGGIKTAGKWGAGIAAGAGVAVGAMVGLASKVGQTADGLLDLNSITGMSTDEIQKWQKAAEVAGVNTDAITNASAKLTKNLDTMSTEGHKGNEALAKLGMSLGDIEGMSADERMDVLTKSLSEIEDKTERAKLGADLFGGSWAEIAPVVDLGAEAMDKAKDSANIISNDDLTKANEFRITMDNMKERASFFFMELGLKLIPMLQSLFDWFKQYMPQIKEVSKQVFQFIGEAIDLAIEWIGKLISWLRDWYDNNQETIQAIKEGFSEFVDTVVNLFSGFIEMLVNFWTEFGDDIIEHATKLWELVQSIFQGAFDLVIDTFNVFAALFRGDWSDLGEKLKTLISNLLGNLKDIWDKGLEVIRNLGSTVFGRLRDGVIEKLSDLVDYFGGLKSKFTEKARGMFDGIKEAFKGSINWIIRKWNDFQIKLGGQEVNLPFGQSFTIPSITIPTPNIPMLAKGGDIQQSGTVLVGEKGAELLDLPKGARVTPLDHTRADNNQPIQYITNITVEGNIDSDLYEEIQQRQKDDFDTKLIMAGVRR